MSKLVGELGMSLKRRFFSLLWLYDLFGAIDQYTIVWHVDQRWTHSARYRRKNWIVLHVRPLSSQWACNCYIAFLFQLHTVSYFPWLQHIVSSADRCKQVSLDSHEWGKVNDIILLRGETNGSDQQRGPTFDRNQIQRRKHKGYVHQRIVNLDSDLMYTIIIGCWAKKKRIKTSTPLLPLKDRKQADNQCEYSFQLTLSGSLPSTPSPTIWIQLLNVLSFW